MHLRPWRDQFQEANFALLSCAFELKVPAGSTEERVRARLHDVASASSGTIPSAMPVPCQHPDSQSASETPSRRLFSGLSRCNLGTSMFPQAWPPSTTERAKAAMLSILYATAGLSVDALCFVFRILRIASVHRPASDYQVCHKSSRVANPVP